jgi:hypothetical protein
MRKKKKCYKLVFLCFFFFCFIARIKSQKKLSKYLTYVLKDELLYYDFGSIHSWGTKKKGKRTPQLS